jgi:uncharacterized membrane protein YkvA (DUF1232 family)
MSVVYLMTHPAVPFWLKTLPVIAFLYLIFPRDLFFDFRAFGHVDDFIVIAVLLGIFTTKAMRYVVSAQKTKDGAIPVEFEVLDRTDAPPHADGDAGHDDDPPTHDLRD